MALSCCLHLSVRASWVHPPSNHWSNDGKLRHTETQQEEGHDPACLWALMEQEVFILISEEIWAPTVRHSVWKPNCLPSRTLMLSQCRIELKKPTSAQSDEAEEVKCLHGGHFNTVS